MKKKKTEREVIQPSRPETMVDSDRIDVFFRNIGRMVDK